MFKPTTVLITLSLIGLAGGCMPTDKPSDYGRMRPPVGDVNEGPGVQGKELIEATDAMAMDLLGSRRLNESKTPWLLVVMPPDNDTYDPRFNYGAFTGRLRTQLVRMGEGRITIVENRDRFRHMQNRELDPAAPEIGKDPLPGPAGVQPEYALKGKVEELPSGPYTTYRFSFTITDLRTRNARTILWENEYLVKVPR